MARTERLSDQVIFVVLGTGVRTAIDVLVMIVLARMLTRDDFGSYRQFLLTYGLMAAILGWGLPASLAYFVSVADDGGTRRLVFRTLIALTLLSLAGAAIVLLLGPAIASSFENPALPRLMLMGFLYPLGQISLETIPFILTALGRFRTAGLLIGLMAFVQAGAVAVPALLGADVGVIASCASLAGVVNFVLMMVLAWSLTPAGHTAASAPSMTEQFRYAAPLGLQGMISAISQRLDRVLVSISHTPSTLAIYSVGATEIPLIPVLPYAIGRALIPRFAQLHKSGDMRQILALWHQSILNISLLTVPCFYLCFLLAPQIIAFVFGDGFVEAATVFRIYLLLVPLRPTAYGAILQALRDTPSVMHGALLAVILNAVLGLVLLPYLGWIGPAIAAVASQVVSIVFYLKRISTDLGCSFLSIWPWRGLGLRMAVGLAVSLILLPVLSLETRPFILFLTAGLAFSVLYVIGLGWTGGIGRAELALARRWLTLAPLRGR